MTSHVIATAQTLRYRRTMKRSTRKLVLRSETIRAFSDMELFELARARGGDGAAALLEFTGAGSGINGPAALGETTVSNGGIACPIQVRALTKG